MIEKRLTENQTTHAFLAEEPSGVVRYDSNWIECNDPMEDRHMHDCISRSALMPTAQSLGGSVIPGIKMFTVLDGNG